MSNFPTETNGAQPSGAQLLHASNLAKIGEILPLPDLFPGTLWIGKVPNEVAYFSALCWAVADATSDTLDRLNVGDFEHDISSKIYESAAALHARGSHINPESLREECNRRALECDKRSELADWENAGDATHILKSPKGDADKIARELADKIAPKLRFQFSSLSQVMTRPDPDFLIARILTLGGTSLLTAKHASFKSFIALDMALSVATGKDWHGFDVRRGAVVYIAAEGSAGIKKRARAWLDHHDEETPENFVVLDVPVQIADESQRKAFIKEVTALNPALIVLDTLARCAVGLEENSSKDMGTFADALGQLAHATGAHVMTVHHNNKGGEYRGSSAVPAAVDTHLSLERKGDTVTLEMLKQKDAEEIGPLFFEKKDVAIMGTRGEDHSIVFERLETRSKGTGAMNDLEQKAFEAFVECYGAESVSSAQWKRATSEQKGLPESSFSRGRKGLIEKRIVLLVSGKEGGKGKDAANYQIAPDWLPNSEPENSEISEHLETMNNSDNSFHSTGPVE